MPQARRRRLPQRLGELLRERQARSVYVALRLHLGSAQAVGAAGGWRQPVLQARPTCASWFLQRALLTP